MTSQVSRYLTLLLVLSIVLGSSSEAAFTPQSPKVRKLCDVAVTYLASEESRKAPQMGHIGGKALLAYALFKYGKRYKVDNHKHPRVLEALKEIVKIASTPRLLKGEDNYNIGMCLIFLIEYDFENPVPQYTDQIGKMLAEFESRQREDGAWSYPGHKTGDTSQTQYAVLALFTARQFGFDIKIDRVARVCNWLMRTQDPTGSWGYQGQDPGVGNFNRIDQSQNLAGGGGAVDNDNYNKAHSDAAAGLGSLYIAANVLQFTRQAGTRVNRAKKRGSLTAKQTAKVSGAPLTNAVNGQMLLNRMADGDRWFTSNYSIPSPRWQYYYLYTYERYQSFKELREGREKQETAKWYDDGVNFLAAGQRPDGTWPSPKGGRVVGTSLAILFLVRSTKIVIGESLDSLFARRSRLA